MRKKLHLLKILRDFVDSKYENSTWKKTINRYTRKENGKWETFIVKEKKSWVSKCTKDIVQCQFVSILPCLNL